jgi:hypothetical protein
MDYGFGRGCGYCEGGFGSVFAFDPAPAEAPAPARDPAPELDLELEIVKELPEERESDKVGRLFPIPLNRKPNNKA